MVLIITVIKAMLIIINFVAVKHSQIHLCNIATNLSLTHIQIVFKRLYVTNVIFSS